MGKINQYLEKAQYQRAALDICGVDIDAAGQT